MDSQHEFSATVRNTSSAPSAHGSGVSGPHFPVNEYQQPSSPHAGSAEPVHESKSQAAIRSTEDALLADAGRIFDQLRIRLAELDHREQALLEQTQELETRETRFSRWVDQTKEDLASRERRLQEQELAADRQQSEIEHQSRKLRPGTR